MSLTKNVELLSPSKPLEVRLSAPSALNLGVLVLIRQPVFGPWQQLSLRSTYGLSGKLMSGGEECVSIYKGQAWRFNT